MIRRTVGSHRRFYIRGYHLEDYTNSYDLELYLHPRRMKDWYAGHETVAARRWAAEAVREESEAHNAGLHFSGDGPFEREMQRRGIQVDKYPLPSTVATKRLHEMVLLRRAHIEQKAAAAMEAQRHARKAEAPSAWYNEQAGPLNPHFLAAVQPLYSADITNLPRTPVVPASLES